MAIIVTNVQSPLSAKDEDIMSIAVKKLGLGKSQILTAKIYKTSLDARKQNNIKFVSSIFLELTDTKTEEDICRKHPECTYVKNEDLKIQCGTEKADGNIVIAGFGPAGMFSALILAEKGYKPIILERGGSVEERVSKVNEFWNNSILDIDSNVQFGEGGAGTFSDGKLTTRIKDPLCAHILKKFVEFGAPQEILTKAKPHIGTDNLRNIVKNIRNRIIELGGEIRFNTALKDIIIENSKIKYAITTSGNIETKAMILAIGHSARDTFEMLLSKDIFIEPKAFSVGARIEHSQIEINKSLYGKYYDNPMLPQGEYQLSYKKNGRCVYTFCMCPGGVIVPAASEENTVVTNGMSEFARNLENANSAVVVSVTPKDFEKNPLGGINLARMIESTAYLIKEKSYKAPAVTVGNFLEKRTGIKHSEVNSSYCNGIKSADFDKIFPRYVTEMMREGIQKFSLQVSAFGNKNALLTAPETRTSSPVRITRREDMQSVSVNLLYPCGEGAGYAGGIMSAAADGMHAAIKIIEKFSD